jgi:hypothetical protein
VAAGRAAAARVSAAAATFPGRKPVARRVYVGDGERWAVSVWGADLPAGGPRVVREVAGIALAPGSVEERAEACLESLRRMVPFQAGWIAPLDPERRQLVPLVSRGYDDPARAYFTSPASVAGIELLGLHRARPPMRLRDFPVPPADVRGWAEYLRPAGFREGLGVGLFAPDGRYLGQLTLNTDTAAHPADAARDAIGTLVGVDPQSEGAAAGVVGTTVIRILFAFDPWRQLGAVGS